MRKGRRGAVVHRPTIAAGRVLGLGGIKLIVRSLITKKTCSRTVQNYVRSERWKDINSKAVRRTWKGKSQSGGLPCCQKREQHALEEASAATRRAQPDT